MWESTININEVREIRGKVSTFFGVGAIEKINDIAKELKEKDIDSVLVVTTKSAYKVCGAWDYVKKALDDNQISFEIYDKVLPNPNDTEVDEASEIARKINAKAVIGIGGGSAIDAGKSAAIMANYPEYTTADLFEFNFTPTKSLPVIAINTTHGTGTEANRVAVVSILKKQFKPAITYDISYPMYSINDPKLMLTLPKEHIIYTSIDAVNHVFEACTTTIYSPYSIMLAKEVIRLVDKYLPIAINDSQNLEARYYLTYAAMMGGICFDNSLLHLTHALEHPLSGVKPEVTHGLGLAILLPSVAKSIYKGRCEVLADVLSPIMKLEGKPEEADMVYEKLRSWIESFGVTENLTSLGFDDNDLDRLTQLAFETPVLDVLIGLTPTENDKDVVYNIYKESLYI